jgi:hypothetical protein
VLPQVRSNSEVYGEASLPATAGVPIAGIRPVLDITETSYGFSKLRFRDQEVFKSTRPDHLDHPLSY